MAKNYPVLPKLRTTVSEITDTNITAPVNNEVLTFINGSWINSLPDTSGGIWGSITGTLSNQTDLQQELDNKSFTTHHHDGRYALIIHTHTMSDITDSTWLLDITNESIKDLSDVLTSMTPVHGEILTYHTTNGWQSQAPIAVGATWGSITGCLLYTSPSPRD